MTEPLHEVESAEGDLQARRFVTSPKEGKPVTPGDDLAERGSGEHEKLAGVPFRLTRFRAARAAEGAPSFCCQIKNSRVNRPGLAGPTGGSGSG